MGEELVAVVALRHPVPEVDEELVVAVRLRVPRLLVVVAPEERQRPPRQVPEVVATRLTTKSRIFQSGRDVSGRGTRFRS